MGLPELRRHAATVVSRLFPLGAALLLAACASAPHEQPAGESAIGALRYIGEQRMPHRHAYRQTVVGGLSGIDYDARSDKWIMVSDDRSDLSPARFYTATLDYDAHRFSAATLTGVYFLRQPDGSLYPNASRSPSAGAIVPDIETLRFDPADSTVWYASEGRRAFPGSGFVRQAESSGDYRAALSLPPMFDAASAAGKGVRDNLSFEGMSFSRDGTSLWLTTESPLQQDGPPASASNGTLIRLTQLNRNGTLLAQYAYRTDTIQAAPAPGKLADNGVSEILAVNAHQLLVLERSGVQGEDGIFRFYIRLYKVDLRGATDIRDIASLQEAAYEPARKTLLLDFNSMPALERVDNLEGIAWGRRLANGNPSLVLVSDDNFHPSQVTQFLVFEALPE